MVENPTSVALAPKHTSVRERIVPLGSLAYMRPSYLAMSAWTEHVPFAFWLIEAIKPSVFVELGTHYGVSYFAFCQALEKIDIGAQAFAVDLWTGDEHSGLYGPEVFDVVRNYNDRSYSHFSTLKKGSFNEARDYFLDGSIDLLHIDGLHTYDAVKNDFESWLPKMSSRGVIVFHDTNVRERNFGVFRLFSEVSKIYPTFEFTHGHGLGVVGVGTDQAEGMQFLFDSSKQDRDIRDLQLLFSRLGRGCLDAYTTQVFEQSQAELKRQLQAEAAKHQEEAKRLDQKVTTLVADVEKRTKEIQAANSARDQLDGRVRQLENELATRDADARKAEEEAAAALATQLETARQALEASTKQQSDTERRRREAENIASERERHILLLEDKIAVLNQGLSRLERELNDEQALVRAKERQLEAADKLEEDLRGRLIETQSALTQRQLETEESASELDKLRAELKHSNKALAEHGQIVTGFKEHVTLLMEDVKDARAAALVTNEHHAKRIREIEDARTALEQLRVSEREKHVEAIRNEKAQSEARSKELFVEIATLTRLLQNAEARDLGTTAGIELGRAILKMIELPRVWKLLPAGQRLKRQMTLLKRSGFFDAEWYVAEYRDVAEAGVDPVRHYIEYGAREGRQPNETLTKGRPAEG